MSSTPPDALRRAANMLEAARSATSHADVDELLSQVRKICAQVIDSIDTFRDPIGQADKAVGAEQD
ncbi:MAG: hypothetical protein ABW252_03960 [Polyangiales bacterium]